MDTFTKSTGIRKALRRAVAKPASEALLAEASDPNTSPARLAELAKSSHPFVQLAALKNPNLGTEGFFNAMFR